MNKKQRVICWFSCGCASAVATKLTVEKYENDKNIELVIAYIYIKNEHEDSHRFMLDCEKWFGYPVTIIKDEKYSSDVDEVIKKTKYMSGIYGAVCTKVLKKEVRFAMQRHDDIHVFGMTVEEKRRIDRLEDSEPDLFLENPLIDNQITKNDCYKMVHHAGIELPVMYKLGYNNNNCIGCLKAGSPSYWNKIRKDFPEVFKVRANQEKLLNVSLCKMSKNKFMDKYPVEFKKMQDDHKNNLVNWVEDRNGGIRIPLRYLPVTPIKKSELEIGNCGFFCELK
jgi:hypothetical protein